MPDYRIWDVMKNNKIRPIPTNFIRSFSGNPPVGGKESKIGSKYF
jgi:hypothetical protein